MKPTEPYQFTAFDEARDVAGYFRQAVGCNLESGIKQLTYGQGYALNFDITPGKASLMLLEMAAQLLDKDSELVTEDSVVAITFSPDVKKPPSRLLEQKLRTLLINGLSTQQDGSYRFTCPPSLAPTNVHALLETYLQDYAQNTDTPIETLLPVGPANAPLALKPAAGTALIDMLDVVRDRATATRN